MGKYNFDRPVERRGSGCIKWDKCDGEGILPMWIADMDFTVAPEIIEQMQRRLDHGVFGYAMPPGDYYGSVCDWMGRRFGYRPDPAWFAHSPGIVCFLHFFCNGFLKPGDKVLVQTPVYQHFFGAAQKNGLEAVENRLLLMDGRYEIDFADFEAKAADPAVKAFFLCNPHNPGGRMWTREELQRMGGICLRNGVLIVSDEIHCDLVYKHHGKRHLPMASVSPEIAMNTITCVAPSKTFNLAGLQTSAVMIPDPALKKQYENTLGSLGVLRPNIFGAAALAAAYRYGEGWLEELLDYLGGNLGFLRGWMRENLPMVGVMEPDATYLVWLDFRGMKAGPGELCGLLLREGKVWLQDGSVFGGAGEGFARINIACPRALVEEGLKRMKLGLERAGLA